MLLLLSCLLAFADGIGSPAYRGVPQISEAVPGYAVSGWFGFCAPRGTPEAVVGRWSEAIRIATQDPTTQRRFSESGLVPRYEAPATFSATIAADRAIWRDVIRGASIRVE
jgi:tripartite-type tricarboxylate transporter receptor subunit TctC